MTKAELYHSIDSYRGLLGFNNTQSVNAFNLAQFATNIAVEFADFDRSLRGVLSVGQLGNPHYIILNKNRNEFERNFDCAHELMHLYFCGRDPSARSQGLSAFTDVVSRSGYIEWEANEGAAELTVPYRALFPMIQDTYCGHFMQYMFGVDAFCDWASQIFRVTFRVVAIRLEALKYEIHQYLNGTPIDNIEFLSRSEQHSRGIYIDSLADLEDKRIRESPDPCNKSNVVAR